MKTLLLSLATVFVFGAFAQESNWSGTDQRIDAEIEKNVDLHSVATAFANIVLPFPGGPYSKMPLVGSRMP